MVQMSIQDAFTEHEKVMNLLMCEVDDLRKRIEELEKKANQQKKSKLINLENKGLD